MARVCVDVPLAHLDRPFDYLVSADDDEAAQPGVRVKVRFAGQLINGFLLERAESSPHGGKLAYLDKVVSPEQVLDPEVAHAARAVADRYAGNLIDVLRLAVPPRHARVEAQSAKDPQDNQPADADSADIEAPALAAATPAPAANLAPTASPAAMTRPGTAADPDTAINPGTAGPDIANPGTAANPGTTNRGSAPEPGTEHTDTATNPVTAANPGTANPGTAANPGTTDLGTGTTPDTVRASTAAYRITASASEPSTTNGPGAANSHGTASEPGTANAQNTGPKHGVASTPGAENTPGTSPEPSTASATGSADAHDSASRPAKASTSTAISHGTAPDPSTTSAPNTTTGLGTAPDPSTASAPETTTEPGTAPDPSTASAPNTTTEPGTATKPDTTTAGGTQPVPYEAAPGGWSEYVAGPAFLRALAEGRNARAVWAALPGEDWAARIAEAAEATVRGGRGVVIVVADARDLDRVDRALAKTLGAGRHVALNAALGPAERYRRFLAASRHQVPVVVGTRAAMWAPVAKLGLVVIWDDGDDLHAEPRSPYPPRPRGAADAGSARRLRGDGGRLRPYG